MNLFLVLFSNLLNKQITIVGLLPRQYDDESAVPKIIVISFSATSYTFYFIT